MAGKTPKSLPKAAGMCFLSFFNFVKNTPDYSYFCVKYCNGQCSTLIFSDTSQWTSKSRNPVIFLWTGFVRGILFKFKFSYLYNSIYYHIKISLIDNFNSSILFLLLLFSGGVSQVFKMNPYDRNENFGKKRCLSIKHCTQNQVYRPCR